MNSTAYIVTNLAALIIGQWLVTRGRWAGFLVWCGANLYSILTCLLTGMPQTSILFGAYFLVNFVSLWSWVARTRAATSDAPDPAVTLAGSEVA